MDYPFGLIHSSETPYLTITYVTSTYQINIVVQIAPQDSNQ